MKMQFGIAVFAFLCFHTGCLGLRDVKLIIPAAVVKGERAVLRCEYDLESDQLYSVKWYKGEREFYRFTPREKPPIKQFPIAGLQVAEEESNGTRVVLHDVAIDNSGKFSCEITADAPSFFTKVQVATLEVVERPKNDPEITGLKLHYRLGETLRAECVSKESRPAANLTWLVNGEPVAPAHIRRHHPKPTRNGALFNAHSALRVQISEQLFAKGRLKIRCVASLYNVYYRSSEKSVDLRRMQTPKTSVGGYVSTAAPFLSTTTVWEYALPAERYPQDTVSFDGMFNEGSSANKKSVCALVSFLATCSFLLLQIR